MFLAWKVPALAATLLLLGSGAATFAVHAQAGAGKGLRERLQVQIQQKANLSSAQTRALAAPLDDFVTAGGNADSLMRTVTSALDSGCKGMCLAETVSTLNRVRSRGLDLASATMMVGGALRALEHELARDELQLSSLRDSEIRQRLRRHIDRQLSLRERLRTQIQRKANLSTQQRLALAHPLDLFIASGGDRKSLMSVVMTSLDSGCDGMCLSESIRALNRARLQAGLDGPEAARVVGGALRALEQEGAGESAASTEAERITRLRQAVRQRLRAK